MSQRPIALVTGPTSGIGREFALRLAQRGYDLVLVSRNELKLHELAGELSDHGAESEVITADLSRREDWPRVERRLTEGVDLLVNNAGFGHKRPFLANNIEDEQAMLDVLVTAVLRFSHAALTAMVAAGSGGVINVSSVAGELPRGTYSAAKAYVTSFSEWADLTYRDQGVRVMALLPGFTRTDFHQRMGARRPHAPRWMWLDAGFVVDEALKDFDRGRSVSIPGKRYKVLTALARYTPHRVQARLQRVGRRNRGKQ